MVVQWALFVGRSSRLEAALLFDMGLSIRSLSVLPGIHDDTAIVPSVDFSSVLPPFPVADDPAALTHIPSSSLNIDVPLRPDMLAKLMGALTSPELSGRGLLSSVRSAEAVIGSGMLDRAHGALGAALCVLRLVVSASGVLFSMASVMCRTRAPTPVPFLWQLSVWGGLLHVNQRRVGTAFRSGLRAICR